MQSLAKPSPVEIENALNEWAVLDNYVLQEKSLKKLFTVTYPENRDIDDVLVKVCTLNDFYSTNIFSPFTIAKHIIELNIDPRLKENDLNLVNHLAKISTGPGKIRNFYSFASKYCSHHKPEAYPIYDSFAEKMLLHFKKEKFYNFDKQELKSYPLYKKVILKFQEFYGLESYTLKEIDKYLWINGKKYFPKKYKKQSDKRIPE